MPFSSPARSDLPLEPPAPAAGSRTWRTRDVWAISLSAFFADLGYQSVLAGLPLFMVLSLHTSIALYGLTMALAFGGGSLLAYAGSRIGDRIGHRRLAIIGNSGIPLLALSASIASIPAAVIFFCAGWWARNLRTPSRRVMLTDATAEDVRTRAFGFLHGLDVGGGILAAVYMVGASAAGIAFRWVFIGTIAPLAVSTFCLTLTSPSLGPPHRTRRQSGEGGSSAVPALPRRAATAILAATVLFGFSSYSIGFPVLTAARSANRTLTGLLAFLIFNTVSAATGFIVPGHLGSSWRGRLLRLGTLGFLPTAAGAALIALASGIGLGYAAILVAVAVLGAALGIVETLEPSLISVILPGGGSGFGMLSAFRSVGLFVGNLAMGLLYGLGPSWSYGYAAIVALSGAVILSATAMSLAGRRP